MPQVSPLEAGHRAARVARLEAERLWDATRAVDPPAALDEEGAAALDAPALRSLAQPELPDAEVRTRQAGPEQQVQQALPLPEQQARAQEGARAAQPVRPV